jgi:hypothetical protein
VWRHWLERSWARVLLGAAGGAIIGVAVYQASRLTHRDLLIICGGLAGVVTAVVLPRYRRSIRLTGITVSVPQFSELQFAVTKDSQHVAWQLFVEAVTRISSQPLGGDVGLLREAMTSLYGIFAITREILKQTQPSRQTNKDPTVEHLAIAMLNVELRPFLSRWHPSLRAWEAAHPDQGEVAWPDNTECRASLAATQKRLVEYVLGFGKLAGVPNTRQIVEGTLGPEFLIGTPAASRQRDNGALDV